MRSIVSLSFIALFGITSECLAKDEPKSKPSEERFDLKVREDIFRGFNGNDEALAKGVAACEAELKKDPKHAEAMVWLGAAHVFQSGQLFQKGKMADGMKLWTQGHKELDDAKALAPDSVAVLIPRAAVLMPAGRSAPPEMGKPLIEKALKDFEEIFKKQEKVLNKIGDHPQGELRMGLADAYRFLGQADASKKQLEAIVKDMPNTKYSERATKWLAAKPADKLSHSCIGCHTQAK